jgi:hypothetical protein
MPTARVNIADYYDAWDDANACHASQGGGRILGIPKWLRRMLFPTQDFTQVYPTPASRQMDDDLFTGVTLMEAEPA